MCGIIAVLRRPSERVPTEGAEVLGVIGIFTWGWEKTAAAFAAAGLSLETLTALGAVLDAAAAEGRLTPEQRRLVEAWAADPEGWGAS